MNDLLIATGNKGKIREIATLLSGSPFNVIGLDAFSNIASVPETGNTFIENAILKARGYARQTGVLALADDSGLEIAALGGRPGVLSARYGGENTGYAEKIEMLLAELAGVPPEKRQARFVCAMALAGPAGEIIHSADGICDGRIALAAGGGNGFGYDPVFVPRGFNETFGKLDDTIKRQISHRARAISGIIAFFADFKGV